MSSGSSASVPTSSLSKVAPPSANKQKHAHSSSSSSSSSSGDSDDAPIIDSLKAQIMSELRDSLSGEIKSAIKAALSGVHQADPPQSVLSGIRDALSNSGKNEKSTKTSLRGKAASAANIAKRTIPLIEVDDDDNDNDTDDDAPPRSSVSASRYDDDSEDILQSTINQAKLYGGLTNWVNITEWRNDRNKHECENLALVIDLLIEEGEVSMDSAALRQLAARLNGVHLADTTGNWNVCNAISYVGPNNSLLPKSLLTKTLKQAAQFDTLSKKTTRKPTNMYRNYDKSNNNINDNNGGGGGGGYFSGVRRDRRNFNRNHSQSSSASNSSSSTSGANSNTSASGSGRQ
jgi:hypothetical protein